MKSSLDDIELLLPGEPRLRPANAICELFDYLDDVLFWIKDRSGRYCWCNVPFLLHYALDAREDIVGKTDDDLSPPHIAAQFRTDDAQVLAGRRVINRIELVGRFDHTASWCVTFKVPLCDENESIIGTAGFTRQVKAGPADWLSVPLGKVASYISQHLSEPLDSTQLARQAGMSERTLERQFRSHYGLSPHQYLKQMRVRVACHALVFSDRPISQIASDHGFADQSHFTRDFRELTGSTPATYRRNFRKSAAKA